MFKFFALFALLFVVAAAEPKAKADPFYGVQPYNYYGVHSYNYGVDPYNYGVYPYSYGVNAYNYGAHPHHYGSYPYNHGYYPYSGINHFGRLGYHY